MAIGPKYRVVRVIETLKKEVERLEAIKTRSERRRQKIAGAIDGVQFSIIVLRQQVR